MARSRGGADLARLQHAHSVLRAGALKQSSMTAAAPDPRPAGSAMDWLRPFANRPRLVGAFAIGAALMTAFHFIPNDLRWSTQAVLSWDLACFVFMGLMLRLMIGAEPHSIRAHAATQDEGQGLILGLAIIAAAASIAAIAAELSLAKNDHGLEKGLRIALAFATVAASWIFVQTVFALHYAHEYYSVETDPEGDDELQGGLAFPGGEPPDYWDFMHFAMVIGVASQTADIAFTSKTLRRTGTVHGVVSFVFNTVVLALTINLLAGLF
jgi:uncharacterized membrane protein